MKSFSLKGHWKHFNNLIISLPIAIRLNELVIMKKVLEQKCVKITFLSLPIQIHVTEFYIVSVLFNRDKKLLFELVIFGETFGHKHLLALII